MEHALSKMDNWKTPGKSRSYNPEHTARLLGLRDRGRSYVILPLAGTEASFHLNPGFAATIEAQTFLVQLASLTRRDSMAADSAMELALLTKALEQEDYWNSDSPVVERRRVLREIAERRGAATFRQNLLVAYDSRCAVTNSNVIPALEAAHIRPYSVSQSNSICNGLLLRADVHTLFDLHLLAIHPLTWNVTIAAELIGTAADEFNGRKLRLSEVESNRPDQKAIEERWNQFDGRGQ